MTFWQSRRMIQLAYSRPGWLGELLKEKLLGNNDDLEELLISTVATQRSQKPPGKTDEESRRQSYDRGNLKEILKEV